MWVPEDAFHAVKLQKYLMHMRVNDRIVDAAEKLFCKALGKIDSFQSALKSQKKIKLAIKSTYSCYMTETTISFFLFVLIAMFRYAIAWKAWLVYTEEFNYHLSKFQRYVESKNWHCQFCLFKSKKGASTVAHLSLHMLPKF